MKRKTVSVKNPPKKAKETSSAIFDYMFPTFPHSITVVANIRKIILTGRPYIKSLFFLMISGFAAQP